MLLEIMTYPMSCYRTGLFDNVDVKVKPMKKGKSQVRFVFREKVWPEMQSFRVAASGESVPHFKLSLQSGCK